jgi:hypothetical protein
MPLAKHRTFLVFVILLNLAIISIANTVAEEVRHPSNLGRFVKEGMDSYREFLEWLNYTGLTSRYDLNLSDVNDIKRKSVLVLEEIYRNTTLAMFIGGVEIKHLKIFANLSDEVGRDDIVKLLKAVAKEFNISRIDFSCRDVFTKFFTNIVKPKTCRYNLTDLDYLTWYTLKLYRGLPSAELTSILSKIYTAKIILRTGAVYEDVLDRILEELLFKESIVLYLILKNVVYTNEVAVITIPRTTSTPIMQIIKVGNKSTGKVVTLEDIEKAMKLLNKLMKISEQYSIDISSQDVVNIISYILSLDIEEALKFIESIDIDYLRYISTIPPTIYSIGREADNLNPIEEKSSSRYPIPQPPQNIPFGIYPYYEGEYYEEFIREFYPGSSDRYAGSSDSGSKGSGDSISNIVSLEVLAKSIAIDDLVEKLNSIPIAVPSLNTVTELLNTVTSTSIHRRTTASTQSSSGKGLGYDIWLYLILLCLLPLGVAIVFKHYIILSIFARFTKVFRSRSEGVVSSRGWGILEFFWVLVERIASVLGVKIGISDTHREAYKKLVIHINDEDLKHRLKEVVKGYEVLRFSDKHDVDVERWRKDVEILMERYR